MFMVNRLAHHLVCLHEDGTPEAVGFHGENPNPRVIKKKTHGQG